MKSIGKAGLGILAVLAFSSMLSVSSAAASPGQFKAAQYPAYVTLETSAEFAEPYRQREYVCDDVTFNATISGPQEELSTTPSFDECESFHPFEWLDGPVTVDPEGCTFDFAPGEEFLEGLGIFVGDMTVDCPEGAAITISDPNCTAEFVFPGSPNSVWYQGRPSPPTAGVNGVGYSGLENSYFGNNQCASQGTTNYGTYYQGGANFSALDANEESLDIWIE
jgi:hypothetical protein